MRNWEQLTAYVIITLMRLLSIIPAIILCAVIFNYNLLSLGSWLLPFAVNMFLAGITGGILIICMLIRFGQSAGWLGWMFIWAFTPFIGVYYPLSILPEPLQWLGHALPLSAIFENLRTLAAGGTVDGTAILHATLFNLLTLMGAIAIFFITLKGARQRGNLLNLNE